MPLRTIALLCGLTVMPVRLLAQHVSSTIAFDHGRGDVVAGLTEHGVQHAASSAPDVASTDGLAIPQDAGAASTPESETAHPAVQVQSPSQDTGAAPRSDPQDKAAPLPHTGLRALFHNLGEDLPKLPSM
jgi:hypothetical protein